VAVWKRLLRHRVRMQDLSVLIGVLLVATYMAFEFDVYGHEQSETVHEETIELNEALTLGGLLAIGLLVFSIRRYAEQRRETRRRIAAEQQARELAFQDPLTGLANRRWFDDALRAASAAPPRAGAAHAVLLFDLNGFKQVNDVYGHGIGDEVLIIVAQRLSSAVRPGDLVARVGGDEFVILAQHLMGAEAATTIARRALQQLDAPIMTGSTTHRIGAGVGIALLPGDAQTPEEAMRKADVALYRAKAERRSALRFFEEEMDRQVHERAAMERDLRAALADDAIQPFYQPSADLRTQRVVGFEAVPRWIHPVHGEIPPERFIPIAEDVGLIHELAERLLRSACAAAMQWPADVTLSFDILPSQLEDRELKTRITRILAASGLPPARLEIEITESALVRDLEAAQRALGALREAGVRIALDNFGTGYSSLYHLRNFKLDKIKIDRSFITSLGSAQESTDIVHALIGLGRGLGLTVTAEGIEDAGQSASLLGTGCDQGQGHLFSGAVAAQDTLAFFAHA
jgi:diguanylate cyclase (GGDEF)-like protein